MKRVPSDLVLLALRQSGVELKPTSLRNWTDRGHITRTRSGYDLTEVLAYVDRRRAAESPPA